MLDFNNAT